MTQIPSARHSTSYYQGHGVDEPQALRTAIANSLPSQSSNPRGRLTFDGSQRPGGNGAGAQAAGTALPAGHPIFNSMAGTPPPDADDPGEEYFDVKPERRNDTRR